MASTSSSWADRYFSDRIAALLDIDSLRDSFYGVLSEEAEEIHKLQASTPALRPYEKLFLARVHSKTYIVVATCSTTCSDPPPLPLEVGGYEVHELSSPHVTPHAVFADMDILDDQERIDPHQPISEHVVGELTRFFPASCGARVLVFGTIVIVFKNERDLLKDLSRMDLPRLIGGIPYHFDVLSVTPTSYQAVCTTDVPGVHSPSPSYGGVKSHPIRLTAPRRPPASQGLKFIYQASTLLLGLLLCTSGSNSNPSFPA